MEQNKADIILFGVSRTSKTPTSIIKIINTQTQHMAYPSLRRPAQRTLRCCLLAALEQP